MDVLDVRECVRAVRAGCRESRDILVFVCIFSAFCSCLRLLFSADCAFFTTFKLQFAHAICGANATTAPAGWL